MQVELASLEPGTVIKTPDAFLEVGHKFPKVIYAGIRNGFPIFWAEKQYASWPLTKPKPPYGHAAAYPLPAAFEIADPDEKLSKGYAETLVSSDPRKTVGLIYSSGCDPEIFVTDAKDKVIPARSVLPKKSPFTTRFYDGLQAEFCPLPGGCLEGLATQIRHQLADLQQEFQTKHKSAKLSVVNTVQLTKEEMDKLSDEDVVFRCSTSMNIYNDVPVSPEPREYLWRFAGGHIHVGAAEGRQNKPLPILHSMVRALDSIVGVAGVSLARNFDTPERRKTYGRAGEFRLPKHGLEYRVLSNYWLCSPLIYHLTFEIARWAYGLGETGLFRIAWDGNEEETRDCINNCDVKLAQRIIKRNAGIYNKLFERRWDAYGASFVKKAMDTVMNGLEVVVKDPTNIAGNWYLGNSNWGTYGDGENCKWRNLK